MEILIALFVGAVLLPALIVAALKDIEDARKRKCLPAAPVVPPRLLLPPTPAPAEVSVRPMRRRLSREEMVARRHAQEEAERQEAERRRREEEERRARIAQSAQEESERQKKALAAWKEERMARKPANSQLASVIEERKGMQYHQGVYLHVFVLVGPAGVALDWRVESNGARTPRVSGCWDEGKVMFRETAFAGTHATQPPPGRHVLSFWVQFDERPEEPDLVFEVFVPGKGQHPDQFRQAIHRKAKEFAKRVETEAQAKRKVSRTLEATGNDPDEIVVQMSRFDAEISEVERPE
jgi:hypothetical protein